MRSARLARACSAGGPPGRSRGDDLLQSHGGHRDVLGRAAAGTFCTPVSTWLTEDESRRTSSPTPGIGDRGERRPRRPRRRHGRAVWRRGARGGGRQHRWLRAVGGRTCGRAGRTTGRGDRRIGHVLLLRHDRTTERRAQPLSGAVAGTSEPARPVRPTVRSRRGHCVPVAGAALPRRTARLVARHDAPGRAGGAARRTSTRRSSWLPSRRIA